MIVNIDFVLVITLMVCMWFSEGLRFDTLFWVCFRGSCELLWDLLGCWLDVYLMDGVIVCLLLGWLCAVLFVRFGVSRITDVWGGLLDCVFVLGEGLLRASVLC